MLAGQMRGKQALHSLSSAASRHICTDRRPVQAVSHSPSRQPAFVAAAKAVVQSCSQHMCTEAPWLAGPTALQDAAIAISPGA